MLSVGTLIWVSLRPLLRLSICVGCGFGITKADIFPPIAARGAGQIMLNIALPCLMFSKIVPAFTNQNISALGPLVLVAFIYEGVGITIGWLVKKFFWVPHRFRYGVLVAGGWGNYGDIPTSVVMSITGAAPFNGTQDQNLAVAYLSAFILVFFVTLFPLGGHQWVAKDYVGPEVEDDEVREETRLRVKRTFTGWTRPVVHLTRLACLRESRSGMSDPEQYPPPARENIDDEEKEGIPPSTGKQASFYHDDTTTVVPTEGLPTSRVNTPEPTVTAIDTLWTPSQPITNPRFPNKSPPPTISLGSIPPPHYPRITKFLTHIRAFTRSLITPASLSIILSFPIALIPPVKALFVPVPGTHIPPAPDGQPPFAFLIDTATFIGAASVPLGLICLGSALARLKVPRTQWRTLPLGAIAGLAAGKMLLMPVLGVFLCKGLVSAGFIAREDRVLQFVCIFFSCLPTATTQVFLTQVYSGTGSAEHLSAFLIPQYAVMFVSMTALTAYTLHFLF